MSHPMSHATSDVLIVMVAKNNLALTKLAVRSVLEQKPPCDALVISNACTDGTDAWLATKPVARMAFERQLSLSACWNTALRSAWRMGYKACLVLNNDLELRTDCVSLLSGFGGDFVTCVSVDTRERMGVTGDRTVADLRGKEREHPDFSAFLIRKAVTDRGLWFNEDYYPAYCEDNDFHVRCHRAGVRCVSIDVPFLHHGASTLKQASPHESVVIRRGADINRERFRYTYGCVPGTPEYGKLFTPDQFGIAARRMMSAGYSKINPSATDRRSPHSG